MHYHSLYKWLERQAKKVEVSTFSVYFVIGKCCIRYSNHFCTHTGFDISVVKTDNFYIVTIPKYQVPKIYSDVGDLKLFLEHFIFFFQIYNNPTNMTSVPEIEEANIIKNAKVDATVQKLLQKQVEKEKQEITEKEKKSIQSNVRSLGDLIKQNRELYVNPLVTDATAARMFVSFSGLSPIPKSLRTSIVAWAKAHPQYIPEVKAFCVYYGCRATERVAAWAEFKKLYV